MQTSVNCSLIPVDECADYCSCEQWNHNCVYIDADCNENDPKLTVLTIVVSMVLFFYVMFLCFLMVPRLVRRVKKSRRLNQYDDL